MNFRSAGLGLCILVSALMCIPGVAFAQNKWDDKSKNAKAGKETVAAKDKAESKSKSVDKSEPAKPKMYRFKSEKKGPVGGAQVMTLVVEDVFTSRTENLVVPNNDATSKELDPLTAVADVVKELKPGDIIEIETEKQKGRPVATSVSKAQIEPGEELPNGYVFVEADEQDNKGMPAIIVTLKKFGREIKVGVPFKKDDQYKDAKWEPVQAIDSVIRRLQSGMVVEALFKSGKPPMLTEIYKYETPERGKFVGIKEVEFNEWPAAGFEILDDKGTTITFTLDGKQFTKNSKTIFAPNPQQFAAIRKLKPDTEVEVRYRLDGRTWMMRDFKVLSQPPATAKKTGKAGDKAGDSEDAGKMQDEKAAGGDGEKDMDGGKDKGEKAGGAAKKS